MGLKELNYANTEYVKDRNVVASTTNKKSNRSNNNSGPSTSTNKFHQKSPTTLHDTNVRSGGGGAVRETNGKTSRRNARSYNPDNNKESHLLFDAKNDDGNMDGVRGDVSDSSGSSSRTNNNGSSMSRRKLDANENVNDDNDNDDDNDDDDIDDETMEADRANDSSNEDANVDDDRNIGFASFSSAKSNLSHMTRRTLASQRITKRQSDQRNIKYDVSDNDNGSANHKTNRRNTTRHQKVVTSVDSVSSQRTSVDIEFGNEHVTKHGRHDEIGDNDASSSTAPRVAHLRSNGGGGGGIDVESRAMLVNSNNINNNNAIVDTFDAPPTAMELECVAGYDGGLPQYFLLEAYDSRTKKLRLNITSAFSDVPLFRIDLTGLTIFSFSLLHTHPSFAISHFRSSMGTNRK